MTTTENETPAQTTTTTRFQCGCVHTFAGADGHLVSVDSKCAPHATPLVPMDFSRPQSATETELAELASALHASNRETFRECDARTLAAQIGRMNILAISGGRIKVRGTGITLPCGNGYSVTVDLALDDTYTVRRVFTRAGR